MGGPEGQTYCLRWNNHKSNLVEILDVLIQKECYVDCTIYVDGGEQFKAHRVVLAANSPYFQSILQDVPMDHCSILVPGVQPFEMRALIEYMYTGEVNVTQSQIPRIMTIAKQLEVKGLYDMTDLKDKFDKMDDTEHYPHNNHKHNDLQSSPIISTSTNIATAQSSSSSPPYNYKPYSNLFSPSSVPMIKNDRSHPWSMSSHLTSGLHPPPHLQNAAVAMLSSVYESGSDMNPLKRKKLQSISSMLMSNDTPILRNVLAQPNVADSSQSVPLVGPPSNNERSGRQSTHSNGTDHSDKKHKYDDHPHSPYTDKSFEEDNMETQNESRIAPYIPQQKPEWKRYKQYTRGDILAAIECVKNGMSALQASRKYGVPSRTLYDKVKKLGITTGRPMNRTMKRSNSNGSSPSAPFPYGLSGCGTSSPYSVNDNHQNYSHGHNQSQSNLHNDSGDRDIESCERDHHIPPSHPAAALLDATFLQQAMERGGDIAGREALHAMALAAAAHAAVNGISTSPGTHGTARSPSPSMLMKYMRVSSPNNPNNPINVEQREQREQREQHEDRELRDNNQHRSTPDDDEVEDLSIAKKEKENSVPQQYGVIVPPMTKVTPHHNVDLIKRETIADDDPHN
ncbi:protein abrupt isoform X2 [Bradysia coprophila]|uniref:protein abrupt isoform X2 n=1 Tax=Bradysia coprophila TaxID=38358 RepID=UPI00187DD683|nr:protein abrupt isoform X2 [Bradysia coprophila]